MLKPVGGSLKVKRVRALLKLTLAVALKQIIRGHAEAGAKWPLVHEDTGQCLNRALIVP